MTTTTPTLAALLRAVLVDPADDTVRLASIAHKIRKVPA